MATKNVIKKIIKDWVEYFIYSTKWEIEVDSELSDTSENPVQNKVVKAAIDWKITNPSVWTVWQVLTKTQNWESWEDAQGWLPEWWIEWQFIRKTASWSEWVDWNLVEITEWWYDYSAMRWPCDEWFHVPTGDDYTWLSSIMTTLWLWTDWSDKLHLPLAWWRRWNTGDVWVQWEDWRYWLNELSSSWNFSAWHFLLYGTTVSHWEFNKAYWMSIRPFKDNFVKPASTWTVIAWTLGSAWIFRDTVNWLISITGDWTTWYTISDKNLWASTVWSTWDTLSEANCGKYYQRWNNYWFAWTWAITTSSTHVDASSYWPWNYYSSSTFITASWAASWDSSNNDNLWWLTTGYSFTYDKFTANNKELAWKEYVDDMLWNVETLLANI